MLNFITENITSTMFYIVVYNVSLISILSAILHYSDYDIKSLSNLSYMGWSLRKYYISLHLFSIAGLPPLLGFIAKIKLITLGSVGSFFLFLVLLPFLFATSYLYIHVVRYITTPTIKMHTSNLSKYEVYAAKIAHKIETTGFFITSIGYFFLDDVLLIIWDILI